MKQQRDYNRNAIQHTETTKKLDVDAEGMEFVLDSIVNLYSRESEAALRETLSNAIDSHVQAGKADTPVQVYLPNLHTSSPTLIVKDEGLGLDEETLNKAFGSFGFSTKRNTNAAIGRFGLGAKAGLAMSDHFFINSVHNGTEYQARLSFNEDGQGGLDILRRKPSDAPNGVEIRIPAKNDDLQSGILNANRFFLGLDLEKIHFYRQTGTRILPEDVDSVYNSEFEQLNDSIGNAVGWVWKALKSKDDAFNAPLKDGLYATIGGVSYPIVASHFPGDSSLHRLARLKRMVVLNIPIGTVKLTPSREQLVYNERTNKTLSVYADKLLPLISNLYRQEVMQLETRSEVVNHVARLAKHNVWNHKIHYVWQDEDFTLVRKYEVGASLATVTRQTFSKRITVSETPKAVVDLSEYIASGSPYLMVVDSESEQIETLEWLRRRISRFMKSQKLNSMTVHVMNKNGQEADTWLLGLSKIHTKESINAAIKELAKVEKEHRTESGTKRPAQLYWTLDLSTVQPTSKGVQTLNLTALSAADLKAKGEDVLYVHRQATSEKLFSVFSPHIPKRAAAGPNATARFYHYEDDRARTLVKLFPNHTLVILPGQTSLDKFRENIGLTEENEASAAVVANLQERLAQTDAHLLTGGRNVIQKAAEQAFSGNRMVMNLLQHLSVELEDEHEGFKLFRLMSSEATAEERQAGAVKAACLLFGVPVPNPSGEGFEEHVATFKSLLNSVPLLKAVFSYTWAYRTVSAEGFEANQYTTDVDEMKFYVKAALQR